MSGKTNRGDTKSRYAFLRQALFVLTIAGAVSATTPRDFYRSVAISGAPVSTSTREGRLIVFDDVWTTINERYYDGQFRGLANGLTWDAQRAAFRGLAAQANSSHEFYSVLRRMLSVLNDPHTRVFSPSEKFDWWRPRIVTTGMAIKEIDGLPTVVGVDRNSVPHREGIRPGDVIEAVNGQPALSLVQRRLSDYVSPGAAARARIFATLTEGPPETAVEIRWISKDGNRRSGQFMRYWYQREPGLRVRRERGGLAVVEMDAFTVPIANSFTRVLKEKLKNAQGIIIDLRGNGGGDAEAMTDVASGFLGAGLSLGRFIDRSGTWLSLSTRSKSPLIPEPLAQTKLPLVVLTSERTSSAAEIFVAGLRTAGRAIVIGGETCGCVLAIRGRHALPDGGLLDISELDYQTSKGQRLERNGIRPDEVVVLKRSDLYEGHDRALEQAMSWLTTRRTVSVKQVVGLR